MNSPWTASVIVTRRWYICCLISTSMSMLNAEDTAMDCRPHQEGVVGRWCRCWLSEAFRTEDQLPADIAKGLTRKVNKTADDFNAMY